MIDFADKFPLFIHLISTIVGFGAVIVIDVWGFLWIINKQKLSQVMSVARVTQILIWIGFFGLVLSGLFLGAHYDKPRTQLKIGLVILLGINGLYLEYIKRWAKKLGDIEFAKAPVMFKVQIGMASIVSQVGWWGTILIGFLTANRIF
ncbi:hypothetical protein KBB41_03270 [Candidatus Curtissbacteria bacterium]|mgnify:CR=1 FL=1|nr:hypothetical protein [Candidatus Curtissbacteria bacterium]